MKGFETIIEKRRDSILRNSLLSDEFINFVQKNKRPFDEMMSYYKCAIMEVATKFRVLNEQYSLSTTAIQSRISKAVPNLWKV